MSRAPTPPRPGPGGMVEQLLREQRLLTPVAEFARQHESGAFARAVQSPRQLLPVSPLVPGEQYAFEVDLEKCSGCKACVTACHSLNGLDDDETWREVGLLVNDQNHTLQSVKWLPAHGETVWQNPALPMGSPTRGTESAPAATSQHVTTACHHCADPACLNGCPVLAYEKDPVSGIVRHLDDQCIGCQYCVLKCPYDVPKYNQRLGIVRKCDMCAGRLAVGEAPACAQACPNEAIRITKVQAESFRIGFRERGDIFLPGAPSGDYTLPTTRYLKLRTSTPLRAADATELKPQPAHWPLALLLVLTQASVGIAGATTLPQSAPHRASLVIASLVLALLGLGASVFHLGRPLGAWRAFLNFRRSWMSREIVVLGVYAGLLSAITAVAVVNRDSALLRGGAAVAALVGLLGVFCSAMIYADTRRELWKARRSVTLFLLTTVLMGAGAFLLHSPGNTAVASALVIASMLKLALEVSIARHGSGRELTPMKKTALLLSRRFELVAFARLGCLLTGGIGLPVLLGTGTTADNQWMAPVALGLLFIGELCERHLFFRCVVAPKMPGGVSA